MDNLWKTRERIISLSSPSEIIVDETVKHSAVPGIYPAAAEGVFLQPAPDAEGKKN